ncbi:hypothetical protein [Hydrogenophaga electricum]|uniref:Death domain-containing protein n=1 Tax=Hydrogenophaga electricum TaxID=1230953 RepID=A0ABQ6C6E5_9BURK|nr:hypothetical protein [Hydrogenophaga electricum]GLS15911.1 hypothetical protein GCM10007935_33480 [Hydrogenophaga electricum]
MPSERPLAVEQQAIVDWLDEVADRGGVDGYVGGAEKFRHDLMQRLDGLSVRVPGQTGDAVTLLYSGPLGDQSKGGWEIAESVGRQGRGKVVTIGETPLGTLQNHKRFVGALQDAVGPRHAHLHQELMNGIRADGSRVESVWDRASRRLAMAAEGDVRTLTPAALDSKVFAQVELPQLLKNPSVTHINGVPLSVYQQIHDRAPGPPSAKLSAVNQAVQASAYDLTREMRWREVPDAPRGAGHFEVDPGRLFEGSPYRPALRLSADAVDFDMRNGPDPGITPEQRSRLAHGRHEIHEGLKTLPRSLGRLGDVPEIRAGTVLKGLGMAGTAYGLYEGYSEFRDALDGARSTRDLHIRGAEAATDMAVRGGVSGTAAVVGGAVGGAGGSLVAPGPGTVGGAIVGGGAAAYGAERAYEDSRVQQWAKALGREVGEISYDYFSQEGRLLRRLQGLQAELAEASSPAERQRLQRELGTVGSAFKAEADRNNAYFDGRGQIDATWEELSARFPALEKGDVVRAYDRRFETGKIATDQAVKGAYSDAVHDEVQARALPYVPDVDYRCMDERGLQQAWRTYAGEASRGQHAIADLERSGPTSANVPLLGGWLGQRRHDDTLETLRNQHWRDSGHQSAIEAAMRERGLEVPGAKRDPGSARSIMGNGPIAAPVSSPAPLPLGAVSRQLVADSTQAVFDVANRHGLPWDQGMTNTVYAVAAGAREAGLARINLFNAAGGVIRAGEYNGVMLREVTLDATTVANTPQAQSQQTLQAWDRHKDPMPVDAVAQAQGWHEQQGARLVG